MERVARLFTKRIHGAWAIAVVVAAAAILLTAIGLKVAELVDVVAGRPVTVGEVAVECTGRLIADDNGWNLEVAGPPGTAVLILVGNHPVQVITLDQDGNGLATDIPLGNDAIRLVAISSVVTSIEPPPEPRWTTTPSPAPSLHTTATPTPTGRPAATPTSTATARARGSTPSPISRSRSSRDAGAPRSGLTPPVLQIARDAGNLIAITFDGNASTNGTSDLLDLLRAEDLRVTMFVTGQFVERNPAVVRRALLAGHEIGNHTYSHPHLTTYEKNRRHDLLPTMTRDRFESELRRTEEAFFAATGRHMAPMWRAPFGEENRRLRRWALELGYLHVRWSSLEGASLDSRDWVADEHSPLYQSSSRIMDRLLRFPHLEGGIVLMHMSTERAEPPWRELPAFVTALRDRDLRIVKISELLESSSTWRPWFERAERRHQSVHQTAQR